MKGFSPGFQKTLKKKKKTSEEHRSIRAFGPRPNQITSCSVCATEDDNQDFSVLRAQVSSPRTVPCALVPQRWPVPSAPAAALVPNRVPPPRPPRLPARVQPRRRYLTHKLSDSSQLGTPGKISHEVSHNFIVGVSGTIAA